MRLIVVLAAALALGLAALAEYVLPFEVIVFAFAIYPFAMAILVGHYTIKLNENSTKLRDIAAEYSRSKQASGELGNAYDLARGQLGQAQSSLKDSQAELIQLRQLRAKLEAENKDTRHQLGLALDRIEAMKLQDIVNAQQKGKIFELENAKRSLEGQIANLTPELHRVRAQVLELKEQGDELRRRTRRAEEFARAREHWIPFALSDEDFASAVAKVFK